MFPTGRRQNNFFRPYKEHYEESENYHNQYSSSRSPNNKYVERNNTDYRPYKNDFDDVYERQTNHKRNKTQVDYQNRHSNYSKSPRRKIVENGQGAKYGDGKAMHEPAWEYLYSFGLQKRRERDQKIEMKKNRLDLECTFEPMIRKTNRYLIPGQSNFLERNRIWNENRIQKIVRQKQEEVTKGLEDCTFKPKLNTYYKIKNRDSPKRHSNHQNCKSHKKMNTKSSRNNLSNHSENQKKNNQLNREEVGKIKTLIRKELKRIQL